MFKHQYQSKFLSIHFPNQEKKKNEIPFRTKPSLFDTVKSKAKLFLICFDNKKHSSCETSSSSSSSSNSSSSFSFSSSFRFRYSSPFLFFLLSSWYNCTKSFKFVAWNLVLDYDQTKQKLQQQQLQLQQQFTTTCQKTRTDNKIRTYLPFIYCFSTVFISFTNMNFFNNFF